MPVLENPVTGLAWFPKFRASIIAAFKQRMAAPFWLWSAPTADLPPTASLGANKGAQTYDETLNTLTVYNGAAWTPLGLYGSDTTYLWRSNNLSDLTNAGTARSNLGLGTSAVVDTGVSGTKVPLLDGANIWSGAALFSAVVTFGEAGTFNKGITANASGYSSNIVFRGTSGGAANTTGLRLLDTDDSHTMRVVLGTDLSANRTLTLVAPNANCTFDFSAAGSVTISSFAAAFLDDTTALAVRTTLNLSTVSNDQIFVTGLTGQTCAGFIGFGGGRLFVDLTGGGDNYYDASTHFFRGNAGSGTAAVDIAGEARCDSLRIDATPSASVATPSTHKLAINCNGTIYYLLLSNV